MSEEDDETRAAPPPPPPPPPRPKASRLVLEAAEKLADWCDAKRREAIDDANRQIRTVWWLLGGGIVLLLALPRLVALIDYTGASLPPDAVTEAASALDGIKRNEAVMAEELSKTEAVLAELKSDRETALNAEMTAKSAFERPFDNPYAVWESVPLPLPVEDVRIFEFALSPDGTLFAVGLERTEDSEKTIILRSHDGTDWTAIRPAETERRIDGVLYSVFAAADGTLFAGGLERRYGDAPEADQVLLLRSIDGSDWLPIRPERAGVRMQGRIFTITQTEGGNLIAGGDTKIGDRPTPLLLQSSDGSSWSPIMLAKPGEAIFGAIRSLLPWSDHGVLAGGWDDTSEDRGSRPLLLRSVDQIDWTPVSIDDTAIPDSGTVLALARGPQDRVVAAGWKRGPAGNSNLVFESSNGKNWAIAGWSAILPGNIIIDAAVGSNEDLLLAGGDSGNGGPALHSWNGTDALSVTLELFSEGVQNAFSDNRRFLGAAEIQSIITATDDRVYISGRGMPLFRSAPEKSDQAQAALLSGSTDIEFLVPQGSLERAAEIRGIRERVAGLDDRITQQERLVASVRESLERQNKAVGSVTKANADLASALRRAEPVRQLSWIATRLAVVALIIFLVQIVVNRYRYLQRLADFYEARARSFRMLADSGPSGAGALLQDVTLNDLTAGLSPEAIGFGKVSEGPTQHLTSLLQAALKK